MRMIKNYLPAGQYFAEETKKIQIVLHHTVSAGTTNAVRDWFAQTTERVATAFVIGKGGSILELFDPKHWAYHIGKGSTSQHNKQSIGIEIVNEGLLTKTDNGFMWFDGKHKYNGEVYEHNTAWRGSKYFAKYTDDQIISAGMLCGELCRIFNIPKRVMLGFNYAPENLQYNGIVSHHNLRPDKSDVSPAFDFNTFTRALG